MIEGFSRPDWKRIREFVKTNIPKENWKAAWNQVAARWLAELAGDLGGNCRVLETHSFHYLSDLEPNVTKTLCGYAEKTLEKIHGSLKEAAWRNLNGKHVLLFFADADDYYTYISYFHSEGTHILSADVFIRGGYAHIALPFVKILEAEHTLAHELVHNLVCHLPIPKWLNEGLAMTIEGQVARRPFILDRELAQRHHQHWNESNIQTFWAGKSYGIPGDDSHLSYSLGEILTNLLAEKGKDFIAFVSHADRRDAGQDAAMNFLNLDLGQVMGGFLGPGNWRPQRKAIAECFKGK